MPTEHKPGVKGTRDQVIPATTSSEPPPPPPPSTYLRWYEPECSQQLETMASICKFTIVKSANMENLQNINLAKIKAHTVVANCCCIPLQFALMMVWTFAPCVSGACNIVNVGHFTSHDDAIPKDKIWVKVGEDKGGGSFKMFFQVTQS